MFLRTDRLEESVNYKSVLEGLTHPIYYTGLSPDLRKNHVGGGAGTLPKLFRRVVNFMGDGGNIDGFKDFLAANPDPVAELKNGHFTNLDTFIESTEENVSHTVNPEDLVFVEK